MENQEVALQYVQSIKSILLLREAFEKIKIECKRFVKSITNVADFAKMTKWLETPKFDNTSTRIREDKEQSKKITFRRTSKITRIPYNKISSRSVHEPNQQHIQPTKSRQRQSKIFIQNFTNDIDYTSISQKNLAEELRQYKEQKEQIMKKQSNYFKRNSNSKIKREQNSIKKESKSKSKSKTKYQNPNFPHYIEMQFSIHDYEENQKNLQKQKNRYRSQQISQKRTNRRKKNVTSLFGKPVVNTNKYEERCFFEYKDPLAIKEIPKPIGKPSDKQIKKKLRFLENNDIPTMKIKFSELLAYKASSERYIASQRGFKTTKQIELESSSKQIKNKTKKLIKVANKTMLAQLLNKDEQSGQIKENKKRNIGKVRFTNKV